MSTALAKVNQLKTTQKTGTDLLEQIADTWVSVVQENDSQFLLVSKEHQDTWIRIKKVYTEKLIQLASTENLTDESLRSFVKMLTSNEHVSEADLQAAKLQQEEEQGIQAKLAAENRKLQAEAQHKREQEAWRKKKVLHALTKLIKQF